MNFTSRFFLIFAKGVALSSWFYNILCANTNLTINIMVEVLFEEENNRSAAYDGGNFVGESTFSPSNGLWIIDHTYVEEAYNGQGIAKKLVETIVNEARKRKVKIIPLCPFAHREFSKRKDYQDVLA